MPDQQPASRFCGKDELRSMLGRFFQQDGYISTIVMHLILLAFGVSAALGKWLITKHTILPLCEAVLIIFKVVGVGFIILISCLSDKFVSSPDRKGDRNATSIGDNQESPRDDSTGTGPSNRTDSDAARNNTTEERMRAGSGNSTSGPSTHNLSLTHRRQNYSSIESISHILDESNNQTKSETACSHIKDNIPLMGILFFVILVCFVNILEMFPRLDCIDEYKNVQDIDHNSFTSSMYMKTSLHVGNLVTWTIFAIALTVFCCKIIYRGEHLYKFWPVRLGLVQLLATLLTIWCDYQLRESREIIQYSDRGDDDNCEMIQIFIKGNHSHTLSTETIECLCQNTSMFETLEHNGSEYILPVNVEFCLLVSESLVHILLSLKAKESTHGNSKASEENIGLDAAPELENEDTPPVSPVTPRPTEMEHFDNLQLRSQNVPEDVQPLLGDRNQTYHTRAGENVFDIIIYIVTFFICLIYLVLKIIKSRGIGETRKEFWETFYHGYIAFFWCISIVVSTWGIILVFQKLKFKSGHKHTGFEMLMILSAFGFYLHASLSLIAACSTRINETDPTKIKYANLLIATTLLDGLQIFLQIVLMFKVSNKASHLAVAYRIPPHCHLKCVIIYFIVLNFVLWIVASFIERKSPTEMDGIQIEFFGHSAWVIIYHITYPLILYFRFNSFLHLLQSTLKIYF